MAAHLGTSPQLGPGTGKHWEQPGFTSGPGAAVRGWSQAACGCRPEGGRAGRRDRGSCHDIGGCEGSPPPLSGDDSPAPPPKGEWSTPRSPTRRGDGSAPSPRGSAGPHHCAPRGGDRRPPPRRERGLYVCSPPPPPPSTPPSLSPTSCPSQRAASQSPLPPGGLSTDVQLSFTYFSPPIPPHPPHTHTPPPRRRHPGSATAGAARAAAAVAAGGGGGGASAGWR